MVSRGIGTAQELRTKHLLEEQARREHGRHGHSTQSRNPGKPTSSATATSGSVTAGQEVLQLEPSLAGAELLDDLWVASGALLNQFESKQLVDVTWGLSASGFRLTGAYEKVGDTVISLSSSGSVGGSQEKLPGHLGWWIRRAKFPSISVNES